MVSTEDDDIRKVLLKMDAHRDDSTMSNNCAIMMETGSVSDCCCGMMKFKLIMARLILKILLWHS